MSKHKTHKGLAARVRITRNGKVMRRRPGRSHLMSSKSGKRRRQLSRAAEVEGRYAKIIKQLI
jgi:large subunit ribosomal protein L35